jgi:acyl-CoA thioesterase FadM
LTSLGGASFKFLQQVRRADNEIAASAVVTMVVFDMKKRAAAMMGENARERLSTLMVN